MNETKPIWASKTLWGAVVMLASTVAMFLKVDLGDQTEWINAVVGLLGSSLAIYGRIKAVKKLGA